MSINFKRNEPLRDHVYYGIGGVVAQFYEPTSINDLSEVLRTLAATKTPTLYVGGGTNTLHSDEPWPHASISFAQMQKIEDLGSFSFRVEAGVNNTVFAEFAYSQGLGGAAWMNRLPGQIGGTVRMNARCYGGEMSQIVSEVWTVNSRGEVQHYTDPTMFRGYKNTIFMENGEAIAAARIDLKPGDSADIKRQMDFCKSDRKSKGQFDYPSCGCVFKNDYTVGVPSGMLLEAAGVKHLQTAHTKINPHHANFVFNTGGASSDELLEVTLKMRDMVYSAFGVWLEYEMEIMGSISPAWRREISRTEPARPDTIALEELKKKFKGRSI